MLDNSKTKFLFRCQDCMMIVSVELDEEDAENARQDKLELECLCGGRSSHLKD